MTTIYTNTETKYFVRYDTMKDTDLEIWKACVTRTLNARAELEKNTFSSLIESSLRYFHSYVYPFSVYYTFSKEVTPIYKDLFSITDKRPAGKWILSYRRYELNEEGRQTYKGQPFSLTHSACGSHDDENYRLDYVYDNNKVGFNDYTILFCLQRDEGLQGGAILFYPHYREENTFTSTMGQLMSQCSLSRKELDVPFKTGSMVMLSGYTRYSMEPLKGKGTLLMMILDFFSES